MISVYKVFFIVMMVNIAFLFVMVSVYPNKHASLQDMQLETSQSLYVTKESDVKPVKKVKSEKKGRSKSQDSTNEIVFTRKTNPFHILGAYPPYKIKIPYSNLTESLKLEKVDYGLYNDDDYCERVDAYNLLHPENMFEKNHFFTDYASDTIPRALIPQIGESVMTFSKYAPKILERQFHLDVTINNFFVNMDGFHKHRKIGEHFLCATQMYNHLPGQRALVRKDDLVESVDQHAKRFEPQPHCFNKQMFFPYSYRLYIKEECVAFFNKINSEAYKESLKTEPIQYIIKVGHGSHSAYGVFLLDGEQTVKTNNDYDFGKLCGQKTESLIAQTYITNPLLLDFNNKFDFRVYMLVASTNPLIVYYHDGFLRASLSEYEKFSSDREKHLTNTHIAESLFKEARESKKKLNGMTEAQLRDYHIWSFEKLEKYLLKSGKVTDPNWLNNHLRPQFKKAMIHIVKMSSEFFWKSHNVYGLFGLDFMLDQNFNLWFIETNPNPQLIATSPFLGKLITQILSSLFEIEYGLYRSRMTRVLGVILKLQRQKEAGKVNLEELKKDYQDAAYNRFNKGYNPSKGNSFSLVMNEYLPGPKAYLGNITPECAELFSN